MARESRETWAKRVERWRESGMTAKELQTSRSSRGHTGSCDASGRFSGDLDFISDYAVAKRRSP
jgi:hypothetical protein